MLYSHLVPQIAQISRLPIQTQRYFVVDKDKQSSAMVELRWAPEPTAPCLRYVSPLKLTPENNSLRIVRMSVSVWIHWKRCRFTSSCRHFCLPVPISKTSSRESVKGGKSRCCECTADARESNCRFLLPKRRFASHNLSASRALMM